MKEKKLKTIPSSVKVLSYSQKKFAKKNGIRIKGKNMSKKEKKYNLKRLRAEYAEAAIIGLNKAVRILAEYPESKKVNKVKDGVENIITQPPVMKKVAKLYKKDPSSYPNMAYLPYMIMNTLVYYQMDNISPEEKEIGASLDTDSLVRFCEKILKKPAKKYRKAGMSREQAFHLATTIPTTRIFKNYVWYRRLIMTLYDMASTDPVDLDSVLKAICKLDKKKYIKKSEFLEGFFSSVILQKASNRNAKFNDNQKELHDQLIDRTLIYLDGLKQRKLREILKRYIKNRKRAEEVKADSKRIIKFIDHANSNSPYSTIKAVVTGLIEDDSSNEIFLS